MKKRLVIAGSAALFLVGIALLVVKYRFGPSARTEIFLGCGCAVLCFGVLAACGGNRKPLLAFAPYSAALAAFGLSFILIPILLFSGAALLGALIGPEKEKAEEKPDIELPPGSGILLKTSGAVYYQLFRGRDRLYLVCLGSRYYRLDPARAIRNEEDFAPKEEDRVVEAQNIRAIRISPDGALRIHGGRGGRFRLQSPAADEAAAYLAGLPVRVERPPEPRGSAGTARAMGNVSFAISLAGGLSAVLWVYWGAPNRFLAALNVTLPLIGFVLFCVLCHVAGPEGKKWDTDILAVGLTLPILILGLCSFRDFNFDSWAQFALPCAVSAACALILLFALCARGRPREIWRFVPLIVFFFAFAVGWTNYILDDGARVTERTAVVATRKVTDESEPTETRYLLVQADGDYRRLKVSREIYDTVEKGDTILLVTHTGPLGIDYTDAELPSQ